MGKYPKPITMDKKKTMCDNQYFMSATNASFL